MEPNIFKYVWRHSRAEQIAILLLVLASLPFYYLSLNLPKQIVNEGIQGQGFDQPGATQPFLALDLPFADAISGQAVKLWDGVELPQPDMPRSEEHKSELQSLIRISNAVLWLKKKK